LEEKPHPNGKKGTTMYQDPTAVKTETPLKFRERLAYGLGDSASNFFFHAFNIFLLNYYVDVFGLLPAAVGTMFFVTKLLDAFTDVGMGILSDRTKTRWGRFRPYLLWMAIPYGLIGYAMFANPDLSQQNKLIYAYITYSAMMLVYTAINIPYSSLLGVISPHSGERETVSTYRFVCAFGAQLMISAFVIPLRDILGGGDDAQGYKLTMGIFALLSTAIWLFTFLSTRERVEPPPEQKSNLKTDVKEVFRNGPWIVLLVVALFTLMNVAVRNGATIFFIENYVTDGEKMVFWRFDRISFFFITGTAAMVVGSAFTRVLTKRFEKRILMIALTAMNGLMLTAFFFIPPDQYWTMIFVNALGTLVVGPTPAIVWAMYADCADYGEWKNGRRTTGLVFSGALFAQKTGLAIGAGLAGWILSFFGYVAGQPQTEMSILGIRLMFSIFPGMLTLLAAACVFFYRIDRNLIHRMEADLTGRRNNGGTPS
jgi:GPH family glycoside/pentoside/hexuronide:cation symporter